MRVVMAPVGTRGDVQPLAALAMALAETGHEVVFCAPPDFREWIEGLGFPFRAAGPRLGRAPAGSEGLSPRRSLASIPGRIRRFIDEILEGQFGAVRQAAQEADVLVGSGVQAAGASVAESVGVPYALALFSPISFPTADHSPFFVRGRRWPGWANRLSWRVYRGVFDLAFKTGINGHRKRLGLPPIDEVYGQSLASEILLAWDVEIAPVPAGLPYRCTQTPAWILPDRNAVLPAEVERFLDEGPVPFHVGFGSMTDANPDRTTRIVVETATRLGRRVILSSGWAKFGRCGALPPHCLAIDDVPHALLFPRVAAVVHHGGAGTIAAAARAGVPQVVVPHGGDQFFHAHRLREAGLVPRPIFRSRLTADRLARALGECLDDRDLSARARSVAERLRGRNGAHEAARHVEALARRGNRPRE